MIPDILHCHSPFSPIPTHIAEAVTCSLSYLLGHWKSQCCTGYLRPLPEGVTVLHYWF